MKILKWILISIVVLVVLAIVAVVAIAQVGFHAVWDSPRVTHDTFPDMQHGIRLMVQPEFAKTMLQGQIQRNAGDVPPWLLSWAADSILPFEITLQSVPDGAQKIVPLKVYVNERRFGPMIARAVPARLQLAARDSGFTWPIDDMKSLGGGSYAITGTLPLDTHTVETIAKRWGETTIPTPFPMDKSHFIELRCDNRGGALYAFASSILAQRIAKIGGNPNLGQIAARTAIDTVVTDIEDVHIVADLTEGGGMTVDLRIECASDCLETSPQYVFQSIEGGYAKLQGIAQRSNVHLEGKTQLDSLVVTGEYETDDIEALAPLISQAGL